MSKRLILSMSSCCQSFFLWRRVIERWWVREYLLLRGCLHREWRWRVILFVGRGSWRGGRYQRSDTWFFCPVYLWIPFSYGVVWSSVWWFFNFDCICSSKAKKKHIITVFKYTIHNLLPSLSEIRPLCTHSVQPATTSSLEILNACYEFDLAEPKSTLTWSEVNVIFFSTLLPPPEWFLGEWLDWKKVSTRSNFIHLSLLSCDSPWNNNYFDEYFS